MSAVIISGKETAEEVYKELREDIRILKEKHGIIPGLGVILAGEDPASLVYVRTKKRMCERLGIYFEDYRFKEDVKEREILGLIEKLNSNPSLHGILIQMPVPRGVDPLQVQGAVSPYKDVDGFHPENMGMLLAGNGRFVSCTPLGVQQMLLRRGIRTEGMHIVIVGRSNIVGKPLAALLLQKKKGANATVTVCHSKTVNLEKITKEADILIAAAGKPGFIKKDMVRRGAVVIDVGISRTKNGLAGDVDFEGVKEKASYITTVPGGVGPMTIAMLMYNTVKAAKIAANIL